MVIQDLLLQGFTSKNHLSAIKRLFDYPDLESVIISVAFLNKAGVDLLSAEISNAGPKIDVYAGIRNDITSRQGLDALMTHGANVHYVDTGARHIIFHPKIYFARAKTEARMVLGSANLTPGGLNNNIEASVTFDLDLSVKSDLDLANTVVSSFADLTKNYPEHVVKVSAAEELDRLQEEGRLLDEASSSPPRTLSRGRAGKSDKLARIVLKVKPIRSKVRRPTKPKAEQAKPAEAVPTGPTPSAATGAELILLWESKPLAERDLSIPSGKTTNPTGSINLDKGRLDEEIDHRHYFREEVFKSLLWGKTSRETVDEAFATFGLIVKSVEHGEFMLRIGHTTSTDTPAYLQRNAMTRLSWGPMKKLVARKDLIGRTMSLYGHASDNSRFVIEID